MSKYMPKMTQTDEALRLLAQMYARRFMRASQESALLCYEQIRDLLYTARSQQEAYEQLARLAESVSDSESFAARAYLRAQNTLREVREAGGNIEAIVVGQTDGFQHLCLTCSQDEENFGRVRFFDASERRPLLKPEVEGEWRSVARCQLCLQPICPLKQVVTLLAGTAKHGASCSCQKCNRAGIAHLVTIYDCDQTTQQILLPHLVQLAAPSKAQCLEQAMKYCAEQGWYRLNNKTVFTTSL